MAHIAKLRKPSNEQAHATPKRWYLPNKATEVSDLIMIGHDSLSSCMSLAILLYCITPQRLCGADQYSARRLRGGHPFRITCTYIGLAANGKTAPNKLLEQADAAMALAANTS